jgi:hypothetical protein
LIRAEFVYVKTESEPAGLKLSGKSLLKRDINERFSLFFTDAAEKLHSFVSVCDRSALVKLRSVECSLSFAG